MGVPWDGFVEGGFPCLERGTSLHFGCLIQLGKTGCRGHAYEGLRSTCTDAQCKHRPKKGALAVADDSEVCDDDKALEKRHLQALMFEDVGQLPRSCLDDLPDWRLCPMPLKFQIHRVQICNEFLPEFSWPAGLASGRLCPLLYRFAGCC